MEEDSLLIGGGLKLYMRLLGDYEIVYLPVSYRPSSPTIINLIVFFLFFFVFLDIFLFLFSS